MNIRIINSAKEIKNKGLVVVIDVFRAFTTACYIADKNLKEFIVVDDVNLAYELKKKNPHFILSGERNGIILPRFNYGNSPWEIKDVNLSDKTVVHTTTLGTRGLISALKLTDQVITGSFVNANAVISYIKKINPKNLYLFCTDDSSEDNEDAMFAKYVKSCLEGKPLEMSDIKKHIINHPSGRFHSRKSYIKHSEKDFPLALELDKFSFILKANQNKDNLIILTKTEDCRPS